MYIIQFLLQIATFAALLFALVKAGYIGGGDLGGSYGGLDGGYAAGGDSYAGYGGTDDSGKDYNVSEMLLRKFEHLISLKLKERMKINTDNLK